MTPLAVPLPDPLPTTRKLVFGEAFADLLGAAQADAPWAYERIFHGFGAAVLGYAGAHGVDDPEGLTNEVFLRAFSNLRTFRGEEPAFRSWLFTIAHHAVVDEHRRRARRPQVSDTDVPDQAVDGGEVSALGRLATDEVRALLDDLSAEQREVLVLRLLGDQTVEQVAQIMGKRVGAVKALQRRGLATLRRRLGAADGPDEDTGGEADQGT